MNLAAAWNTRRRNWAEAWNDWRRNLICMWASQLFVNVGFFAAFAFISLYMSDEKFHIAGKAMRVYYTSRFFFYGMLAYAIFTPLWGWLSDRWGVKIMLYRGCFVTAFIYPLMGLVTDVNHLIALRFLTGALSGTTIAAQLLLVKTAPSDRQGYALGVLCSAIWGGHMIGEALGGVMAHLFGCPVTFMICGALFLVSGLFVIFVRDSEKAGKAVRTAPESSGGKIPGKLANLRAVFIPAVMLMLVLFLFGGIVLRFTSPYAPMMVEDFVGEKWAKLVTGIIGAFAAAAAIISGVIVGRLSDRFPEWKITTPMQLAAALMLLLAAGSSSIWGFGICHVLCNFALGGMYAVFQKVAAGLVERIRRGAVLGCATTMYNVGYMMSMKISGGIARRTADEPVQVDLLRFLYRLGSAMMFALTIASAVLIFTALRLKAQAERKKQLEQL